MANTLRNLKITRVALVDKGANQHAHILLYKADSLSSVHVDRPLGTDDDVEDYVKGVMSADQRNNLPDSAFAAVWVDASGKKQRKLPYRHADGSIDNGHLAAARGRLHQTPMPDNLRSAAARALGDSGGGTDSRRRHDDGETMAKGAIMKEARSLIKRMLGLFNEKDVAKRDTELAAIAKAVDDEPDADDVPIHKADDPDCKCAKCMGMSKTLAKKHEDMEKSIEAITKRAEAAEKRAKDAEDIAKAEQQVRKRGDMVTLLKSFRATPLTLEPATGETTCDVDEFLKMQETNPAAFTRTIALLKAADAQVASSAMYQSFGSSRSGPGASAWEQIEAKADARMEKNSDAAMTREMMINKIMDENPKLVIQYRQEQQ